MEVIPYIDLFVDAAERKGLKPTKKLEQHLQEWIDASDIVVLLIGLRYGSKSDDGVNWTEKEVQYALSKGKCVFCYIREHPEIDLKNIDLPIELKNFISTIQDRIEIAHIIPMVKCIDSLQWLSETYTAG